MRRFGALVSERTEPKIAETSSNNHCMDQVLHVPSVHTASTIQVYFLTPTDRGVAVAAVSEASEAVPSNTECIIRASREGEDSIARTPLIPSAKL